MVTLSVTYNIEYVNPYTYEYVQIESNHNYICTTITNNRYFYNVPLYNILSLCTDTITTTMYYYYCTTIDETTD